MLASSQKRFVGGANLNPEGYNSVYSPTKNRFQYEEWEFTMSARVSICIPCHKSERFIRTAIESALAQTVPAMEILVSDDNSPDRTYEIATEYDHIPTVRVLRTPRRLTVGEHYRFLLESSTGEYVCFLSHDDALMPRFIETMERKLEEGVALVAAGWVECDNKLSPRHLRGMTFPTRALHPPEGYLSFRGGCIYKISFSLMNRRLLAEIPHLPSEADVATDWYWALMLGLQGTVKFLRVPLGYYRWHEMNVSQNNSMRTLPEFLAMLEFVKGQVGAEFKPDLDAHLRQVREEIAVLERGESVAADPHPVLNGLKGLVKDALALRYRRLPEAISKAESGVGVSLGRAQRT